MEKCHKCAKCSHSKQEIRSYHTILWHTPFADRKLLDFSRAHFNSRIQKSLNKKLLVKKQAFLTSPAMLEWMVSGRISLPIALHWHAHAFVLLSRCHSIWSETTEVPFRAQKPIISVGLRPFAVHYCKLLCVESWIWSTNQSVQWWSLYLTALLQVKDGLKNTKLSLWL